MPIDWVLGQRYRDGEAHRSIFGAMSEEKYVVGCEVG